MVYLVEAVFRMEVGINEQLYVEILTGATVLQNVGYFGEDILYSNITSNT